MIATLRNLLCSVGIHDTYVHRDPVIDRWFYLCHNCPHTQPVYPEDAGKPNFPTGEIRRK